MWSDRNPGTAESMRRLGDGRLFCGERPGVPVSRLDGGGDVVGPRGTWGSFGLKELQFGVAGRLRRAVL